MNAAMRSRTTLPIAAVLAAFPFIALCAAPAYALDPPAPQGAAATAQAQAGDSNEAETPNSTEQGQTQLTDSFENRPVASLLHESQLRGLRDTTINVELRTDFLNRDNFNKTASEAWALGGSADSRPATSATSPRWAQLATPRSASMARSTRMARSCCNPVRSNTPWWGNSTASSS